MAIVYRHIRLDNGIPFYVGISKSFRRAYSKNLRNSHWCSVAKKYGFEVEILFDDLTYEEAKNKEIEFIKLYGRRDNNTGILVNMTNGGDGALGCIQSDESKQKKRVVWLGRKHTTETIKKMSESQKGVKNHQYYKKGILNKNYGLKRSEECRKKLSELGKIKVGEKNPMFGKKHSEEAKQKMRDRIINRKLNCEKNKND
jgi:hypothetical protein